MTAPTTTTPQPPAGEMPRLKARYRAEIAPALSEKFSYGNPMQIPGVVKVVVNNPPELGASVCTR